MKITTIGWWNGQSNLLWAFSLYLPKEIKVSSIVSMSDDWRTTWELMRASIEQLGIHLPPPWDLRKCLYNMSSSKYLDLIKNIFENIFRVDDKISIFTLRELLIISSKEYLSNLWKTIKSEFSEATVKVDSNLSDKLRIEIEEFIIWKDCKLKKYFEEKLWDFMNFKLPLENSISWHKFWNILMASIYYNLKNYDQMIKFMHNFLEVRWNIIPVTTWKAFIKAVLWNWEVIETQDRISNVTSYNSWIADLKLMEWSENTSHSILVNKTILESDYIIIWPWDLFTSIISNFIIGWVRKSILESKAKIIYIWNSTNKWWETTGLTQLDFVNKIERFLWKRIDYFIVNNKKPVLSKEQEIEFKNDISVQWWDYLLLSRWEKKFLERLWVKVIEEDLLDNWSFYKHNKKKIVEVIKKIIK